jgi:hypothetical protein
MLDTLVEFYGSPSSFTITQPRRFFVVKGPRARGRRPEELARV